MFDIEKILQYFEIAKSHEGTWDKKDLCIITSSERLSDLVETLNDAGFLWCDDKEATLEIVKKYTKNKLCGIIIYSNRGYYFLENQEPYDDSDLFIIDYHDVLSEDIKIDTNALMSLMENI